MLEQSMASRDLVRFRSELPEHVLDAAVKIEALHISAPTGEEGCAYCRSVENGDVEADTEVCEHYARLQEASSIEYHEVRPDLTPEEEELLDRDELLELAASRAEWEAHSKLSRARGVPEGYCLRHLWEALPEGYYAVEDPRAGVEDMTYWRRKDKGKNKRPAFDPWPLKARYAPVLYTNKPYSQRAQLIAAWPEQPFEAFIAECKRREVELTISAAREQANRYKYQARRKAERAEAERRLSHLKLPERL